MPGPVDSCDSKVHDGPVEPDDLIGADGVAAPSRGTWKRLPNRELRQLMLDHGRAILQEEGIETASNNLTFKRVFDRVERTTGRQLTNASVIKRVWENQSDYQADVLVAIAHDEQRPEVEGTLVAVGRVLDSADLTTVEGRMRGMSEICRVAGGASRALIAESTSWPLWISVVTIATTSSNPDQKDRLCTALAEGYGSVEDFWEGTYRGMIDYLGLRLRAPRTLRQFTQAVTSLSEGDSLHQHVVPKVRSLDLPTGPDGEMQEWTLYAVTLEALAIQFFEPDPDFVAP